MKLLSLLLPFALAQDYDERKKGQKKVESFDCDGEAIGDAIASATNVIVHGCLDFQEEEVVGSLPMGAFPAKRKGAIAMCKFDCAEGFKPGHSERALIMINEERKKKGKKPKKKGGKKKRKPGKVKPPKKGGVKKGGIKIMARCVEGEGWSYVKGKKPMAVSDLVCE